MFNKLTLTTFMLSSCLLNTAYTEVNMSMSNIVSHSEKSKDSNISGSIEFQSNQFVQNVGNTVGNDYFGEIRFNYDSSSNDLIKKIDTSARMNDRNQLMFSLSEAYLKTDMLSGEMTFGRTVLPWNKLDELWGFGKINNRRNFDFYEPGQEGLVGVLYEKKWSSGFKISVFLSPLYVPEMNPGQTIDKENGRITCDNPWCKPVSSSTDVSGSTYSIFYDVDYPEISDVIFRYTTGYRISWENESKAWELSHYALRKPENQISIAAEVSADVDQEIVFADVTPEFYYHDVFGVEVKFRPYESTSKGKGSQWIKGLTLYGSALSVRPEKFPDVDPRVIEYTGLKPEKRKEDYIGAGAIYNYGRLAMGLGYVARISEFDVKNDMLAESPRWNQAINFSLYTHLARKLSAGLDIKVDMLTDDRVTMFRANYELSRHVIGAVGVNMIGAGRTNSFWSDFENNDSVYASLKYVY